MRVLVLYYSRGGTTKKMAELIAEEIEAQGIEVDIFNVEDFKAKDLLNYDGIAIGSPTYYGACAAPIKKLLDESVALHKKLDGRVGMAFSSSANIAGGNETTLLSILEAMLIHGMIVQGDPQGDHYGPVGVGRVDKRTEENCKRMAFRFSQLLKRVRSGQ